jgi:glycerol-3-phosphate dehydrogenase
MGVADFSIRPRKGQFIVYDKPAAHLFQHILLPVPGKLTKGIVVCRTVYGNVLVGPTAEEQDERSRACLVPETLRQLQSRAAAIVPALATQDVTALYAGLRPATEFSDYQINKHAAFNCVTVGGIRSTGLSSALGTADYVFELSKGFFGPLQAISDPVCTAVPNISEFTERDWQKPGNRGIICHCESVTRREIETALQGPLAAQSPAGLKRRTRVSMGRCQGYYCGAEIATLFSQRG